MTDFHVSVGECYTFSKTVSESDVYLFAGLTGDLAPNHVNEAMMAKTSYGARIAHGALLVGFMSTASTHVIGANDAENETAVSLGYDKVRFLAPVYFGDTVTVTYSIDRIDPERRRSEADIKVTNQAGVLVAVARHILKWVPNS
ncbi:hypothetical protein MNBD_ALPHA09-138 [hydrothermal vent metagenome]|uniref:MaoC-like domain-containing protein n=1 Tax=hydrothermal vent metagenome TaxID=652676 RepID=A0A3B0SXW5_9ZZZZ